MSFAANENVVEIVVNNLFGVILLTVVMFVLNLIISLLFSLVCCFEDSKLPSFCSLWCMHAQNFILNWCSSCFDLLPSRGISR